MRELMAFLRALWAYSVQAAHALFVDAQTGRADWHACAVFAAALLSFAGVALAVAAVLVGGCS